MPSIARTPALACAHGNGIVHRDIKPSNVMVDREGQVKAADFWLAKMVTSDASLLTASDVAFGTPAFMAPEAFRGAAHVDHRADLYAVGAMLYRMLTGQLPRGRFSPPSHAVAGLDQRFDRIVDRALQPQPGLRYASAVEMQSELAAVQGDDAGGRGAWPRVRGEMALSEGPNRDAGSIRDKPEACRKLAGGAARNERNPRKARKTRCPPKEAPEMWRSGTVGGAAAES